MKLDAQDIRNIVSDELGLIQTDVDDIKRMLTYLEDSIGYLVRKARETDRNVVQHD